MLGGPHPISWRLIEQRLTSFKQEGILPQTSSGHKLQLFPQPNSLFPTPSDFVLSKHPQSHEPIPYNQLLSLSIYLHTHTHTYTHVYTHPMGSVSAKNPNTLTYPLHSCCSQRKYKCLKFDSTDWIKVYNEVTPHRKYTHRSWFGLFTENISWLN